MADDDAEARRKRAAQLREQIQRLKKDPQAQRPPGGVDSDADGPARQGRPESPREFIGKRMRELDAKRRK
jgi:hypothetical protein